MKNKVQIPAHWDTSAIPDQTGKNFLITGATSGLGLETAKALAAKNAHVTITARSAEKGEKALKQTGAQEFIELDLADLSSVHKAAKEVTKKYDVVFLNAGIMVPPFAKTVDGFESQMATNHLGHFAFAGKVRRHLGANEHNLVLEKTRGRSVGLQGHEITNTRNGSRRAKEIHPMRRPSGLFPVELTGRVFGGQPRGAFWHPKHGCLARNIVYVGKESAHTIIRINAQVGVTPATGSLPEWIIWQLFPRTRGTGHCFAILKVSGEHYPAAAAHRLFQLLIGVGTGRGPRKDDVEHDGPGSVVHQSPDESGMEGTVPRGIHRLIQFTMRCLVQVHNGRVGHRQVWPEQEG